MEEIVCVNLRRGVVERDFGKIRDDSEEGEESHVLLGNCSDTEEARDKWIDETEKLMEFEGFERGQKHCRKGFDDVRHDGDYGLDEPPKWMLGL